MKLHMDGRLASKGVKWHNSAVNRSIFILKLTMKSSKQDLSGHIDIFNSEYFFPLGGLWPKFTVETEQSNRS